MNEQACGTCHGRRLNARAQAVTVDDAAIWELTQLSLETVGAAYWLLDLDGPFGTPAAIWPLPAHKVRPHRERNSADLLDWYEYRDGSAYQRYEPGRVIRFALPDPRDPYLGCLSPLRATFEQVALHGEYTAMRRAVYDNTGIPSVLVSPDDVIGEDERDRELRRHGADGRSRPRMSVSRTRSTSPRAARGSDARAM